MAIPLSQLNTWSHQGAIASSASAYSSIQHALTKATSPLAVRKPEIFLQGSYKNNTNIYGDSDIDVVVMYEETFFHDLSALPIEQQQLHAATYGPASYTWQNLRDDVLTALVAHYGTASVSQGSKSIKVKVGQGRPADVVPVVQFRRYSSFLGPGSLMAHWGVQFFDTAGAPIVNYPKYHHERGVDKNSEARTKSNFKSVVRIFKNLRNWMVDHHVIKDGMAPSYFIECALHNVPDAVFSQPYDKAVVGAINFLLTVQYDNLRCQNGVTGLIGEHPTQWSATRFAEFVVGAKTAWDNWS